MKVRFGSSFPDPNHCRLWTAAEEDLIPPTFIRKSSNMQQIMGSLLLRSAEWKVLRRYQLRSRERKSQLSKRSKYHLFGSAGRFCLQFLLTEAADARPVEPPNPAGSCVCSGVVTAKG